MKHSSPISLFSFQDIITSLTGILIVIILIMALKLIETMTIVAARSELLPDYLFLKQTVADLDDAKTALQQANDAPESIPESWVGLSLPEMQEVIAREQRYHDIINKYWQAEEQLYHDANQENEKITAVRKKVADELAKLDEEEKVIQELQATLLQLQHQQEHLDELIERKRVMLRVTFQGKTVRQPIMVECNEWGFRARHFPDGELVTFGAPSTQIMDQLPHLCSWLKKQNVAKFYIALLIKENVVAHTTDLTSALYDLDPGLMLGKEPIGAEENFFHE